MVNHPNRSKRYTWLYRRHDDKVLDITSREANTYYRHTDAGANLDEFVVEARTWDIALDGARRWVACWSNDDEKCVPDDLFLREREWRSGKTFMVLRVED